MRMQLWGVISKFDVVRWRSLMIFGLIIKLCPFFILLIACNGEPQKPLRVASHEWPGYEPLHLARELGFFDEALIHLYEVPSATSSIRAFRDGFLDAAALTLDEALMLLHDHVPVKVLFVMDISNGADALLAQPELKDMQELKGKSIGVESIALGAYVMARALEKAGMAVKDVDLIYYPFHKHKWAFENRKVDGLVTFEPVKGVLQKAGASVLLDSSELPYEIFDVFVVHERVLKTNPTAIRMLVDAWFKALDYMKSHPTDAANLIAHRIGSSPEQFLISLEGIILPNRSDNLALITGTDPKLVKISDDLANLLLHFRLMNSPVKPEHLIYSGVESFLLAKRP